MKVCIIGSGKWGTAISNLLKQNAVSVTLISRNDYTILKTEKFDIAFIALRTEGIEAFLKEYIPYLPKSICSISKGIFTEKIPFLSEKMEKEGFNFALLSGPNFADEVERREQTITTIASKDLTLSSSLQKILTTSFFKVETTSSIKAIETFAIFKNIIAIYTGFMEKNNFSANTKSMIFTLLIQEMMDFLKKLEQQAESFFLSAGIGDIFLTATSSKSRNFEYGYNFSFTEDAIQNATVEGVRSLSAIPYLEEIYNFNFNYYKKLHSIFIQKQDVKLV